MPALQALAGVPSFGGQLGAALGGGISQGINSSLNQMLQQKEQKRTGKALAEYLGKPEMADQIGELPFEIQKIVAQSYGSKQQEAALNKENAIRSIDEMRNIIDRGNTGWTLSAFTQEGMGDRAALDTAALNLERLGADMVGKGTLAKDRFNFLKERIPSSNKTDAQNRAILDEWEKELGGFKEDTNLNKPETKEKVQFNPENQEHKARAIKLHKALKDKEKVREQLKKEFIFDVG